MAICCGTANHHAVQRAHSRDTPGHATLQPFIETAMSYPAPPRRSVVANAVYGLLNPIPFGFFVATLIFDITYAHTAVVMWGKTADWLVTLGLLFAVIPRLINLTQVWITSSRFATRAERIDFWLNLLAIVAAIFNAFVHSRDAYEVVPASVWLSLFTVILLAIGRIVLATSSVAPGNLVHE
jgi:uncharacterized membrane protein